MKIAAIIQARMGSTRLPGKVMLEVKGKPLIGYLIDRVQAVGSINEVVVAMPLCDYDTALRRYCSSRAGVTAYCGGEEDDLCERLIGVIDMTGCDGFIRLCGDSPLVDPMIIADAAEALRSGGKRAFFSNVGMKVITRGNSVEATTALAFKELAKKCLPEDREHAGFPWLYREISSRSLLVDTPDDFDRVKACIEAMDRNHLEYGWQECAALL